MIITDLAVGTTWLLIRKWKMKEFKIIHTEIGDLKVPIKEEMYIHVIDSFTLATSL